MTAQGRHLPHRRRTSNPPCRELQQLLVRSRHIGLRSKAAGANPELVTAYRTQKMLKLALCVAYGALNEPKAAARTSAKTSRVATMPQWLKRTLATWRSERDAALRSPTRRSM